MRVMDEVDAVAERSEGEDASAKVFEDRKDLPAPWDEYPPEWVKQGLVKQHTI